MRRLIYISDFNMGGMDSAEKAIPRSGYANIGIELCRRLAAQGHQIIVLGLGYTGQEHWENYSIVPCETLQDAAGYINNLKYLGGVDAIICALDIHHYQEKLFPVAKQLEIPYVCITPLESGPLCITWANLLMEMNKVFFISQFGADEAQKAGVDAKHIEIGIDTEAWRVGTPEEYVAIRKNLGFSDDDFVVMTVADNQERKALGRGFQIVAELKLRGISVKHILVTREHSFVGWKLYDLAYEIETLSGTTSLSPDLRIFQSGMPFADLYALYCGADAYLSCSRGEGLGLPIMEAMSVGLPVVANKVGALPELLADGRGWIVEPTDWNYDPFGNQKRYDISIKGAVEALLDVRKSKGSGTDTTHRARKFMESRSWERSAQQVNNALEEIFEASEVDKNGV